MYNFYQYIKNNDVNKIKDILFEISEKYNIKLYFAKLNTVDENFNDIRPNNSYSVGNEIYIGQYTNLDLLIASFFHELGHCLSKIDYNEVSLKFHYELNAWNIGLNLGIKYGYYIKPTTYKYCMDNYLYSYIDYEVRESRGYKDSEYFKYYN